MSGYYSVERTVAVGLTRGYDEMMTVGNDERHIGLGYPAGLGRGHYSRRAVLLRFSGHRPSDGGRRIATTSLAVQVDHVALFRFFRSFDAHVTRTVCKKSIQYNIKTPYYNNDY